MPRATRITAAALSVYAGILGIEHGVFTLLQGNVAPNGLLFNAIGPPCQAETVWHACLPAMTLVPNLRITGLLTIIIGLLAVVWAVAFVQKPHGGWVLIALFAALLLVGGGFVPAFIGWAAGVTATRLHASSDQVRLSRFRGVGRFLAALWPWTLVFLFVWLPGGWLLGHIFGEAMLRWGFVLFFLFDLVMPLLTALSGRAHDVLEWGRNDMTS
jgi:hypothetical protein